MSCSNPWCSCGTCLCGPGCQCGGVLKQVQANVEAQIRDYLAPQPVPQPDQPEPEQPQCVMDDDACAACLEEFKRVDPGAAILPGIGLPSENKGVCTITHGLPGMAPLRINGLTSLSPLANNALFSAECSEGRPLSLYEVMVPDKVAPEAGQLSSAEAYVQGLSQAGLQVAGVHFHWFGMDPFMAAIHHQSTSLDPVEFARRTADLLGQRG